MALCYQDAMKCEGFPNVTGFKDRHGKWRWRYRKTGQPVHCFQSDHGTPAFTAEYAAVANRKPFRATSRSLSSLAGMEVIYFVAARNGPVKIGRTANMASRLIRLQTANHKPLELLAVIRGGAEEEAALHRRFASEQLHGEWFRRSPELSALIRENRFAWWQTLGER